MDFDSALTQINNHLIDLAHATLDRLEAQTIAAAQEALASVDKLLADEVKSAAEPVMAEALGLARAPIRELAASLTRFVAASLREATVFDAASLDALSNSLARYMSEALRGTPVHDVILITSEHATDEQKLEAIRRLAASKAFSRKALFHPLRWNAISDGFNAYCAEQAMSAGQEISAARAWERLIAPALVLAFAEASREAENKPIAELWRTAHNVARREIEMAILDGRTLDQRGEEELPEDENGSMDLFSYEPDDGLEERDAELLRRISELLTRRELEAVMYRPTDNAGIKARKRAMDKIRRAGLDFAVTSSQTLKQD